MKRLFLGPLFLILCAAPASAILDTNNNGMSDVWERIYNNGNLFPPSFSALADNDCDGWTNGLEAIAGTDPNNANASGKLRLEVSVIHNVMLDLDNDGVPETYADVAAVTWPIIAGKQYTLLYSPVLAATNWTAIEQAPATADGTRTSYFPIDSANPKMFWRLKVEDIDSDGDGLTDAEEYKLGTDPFNPQTIPGIPDSWLAANFTNVLLNGGLSTIDPDGDPDGDGYTNLQEAYLGTDPNTPNYPPIGQETIINGDFSQPVIGSAPSNSGEPNWDYWTGGVPGWSAVTGTNIEVQTITPQSAGNQYVELKAHPEGHYGIRQDVGTHKGVTYLLCLACRDRADTPPAASNFNILIDGQILTQINFSSPTAPPPARFVSPGAWTKLTLSFVANNPVTRIALVPVNSLDDTTGCLVDDVSIAPLNIVPDTGMAGVVGDVIKSATVGSAVKHFVTPKKTAELPQDYVVLQATGITADQITVGNANQMFAWDATVGEPVPNDPTKWRVRRDIAAKNPVRILKLLDNSVAAQMVVWVVWSDVTATPATGYQFTPKRDASGVTYAWMYTSPLETVNYWRFQFNIQPVDITVTANNADIPNLMGDKITDPPGANINYFANPDLKGDHATLKWDVSRQTEVTVLNTDLILKTSFPPLAVFANQTKDTDVPILFPDNPVQGNDDPGGPQVMKDEDDNPYQAFSTLPKLAHDIGQLSSCAHPEFTFLNSIGLGQSGCSLALFFNYKEFARLNIVGASTPQAPGAGWYRISDQNLWHYVMSGLYGEFPIGCGVASWVTCGSETAVGRFNNPLE